ncbi:MAG: esterase [Mycobacterium sp.]|nr:esterase [Mycobacterium sp.]
MTPLVLVHGGMHGSWCWDATLPFLESPFTTVDLPGRGRRPADLSKVTLADCVDAVIEDADAQGFSRFVLVGHSLGGVTITETAVQHPDRIAALVYVGALIPGPAQSASEVMTGGPSEAMPVLPEELARTLFGTGLDDEEWAEHYAGLVPDAPGIMNAQVSGYPADIPITYVSMTLDQPVPPPLAQQMVGNLGPSVDHRIIGEAGHTVMATHPAALAEILNGVSSGLTGPHR